MKRILATWVLVLSLLLSGCTDVPPPSSDDPIFLEFEAQTWQITCSGGKNSLDARTAEYFSQLVYRETNGAVTVTVHPGNTLTEGDASAGLQNVLDGGAGISLYSSLLWSQKDPRFTVLTLPFLFSSETEAAAALDGDGGDALAKLLKTYGQHCIGIGSGGFRCPTNSIRPIASPADMQDLRIRVDDLPVLREAYGLWGAQCVRMDWPLVYTALRTGTHDGQEMPFEVADASSVQDVQTHVTDWTGLYSGLFFCMNRELYDSLSPTLREIVDECGKKTVEYQRRLMDENARAVLSRWRKAKVTVTVLTPEAAAEFRSAAQPLYNDFSKNISADLLSAFVKP